MRKQRRAEEQAQRAADAKQWRDTSLQEGRKKVVGGGSKGSSGAAGGQQKHKAGASGGPAEDHPQQKQQQQQQPGKQQGKRQQRTDGSEGETASLAFSKLDFGSGAFCYCTGITVLESVQECLQIACAWSLVATPSLAAADGLAQKKQRRKQSKQQLLATAQEKQEQAAELATTQEGKVRLWRN